MARHLLQTLIMALLGALAACTDADDLQPREATPLVIEGWIEDDGKPIVIVTRAADLSTASGPIDDLVQRWCRVTVSDGEESEILAMHIDHKYTPPVIYTSARLRGKVGHTYTLTVETDIDTATAMTTIPPVVGIDSLCITPNADPETYNVKVFTSVDPAVSQYYKIFTKVNSETRYYSSFLGLFTAYEYDAAEGWNAARGIHQTFGDHFTPNYVFGDTVNIKLCTMDADAYVFWKSYETAVSLQTNFFFNTTEECQGNIVGGKGYWAGYGTSLGRVIIK